MDRTPVKALIAEHSEAPYQRGEIRYTTYNGAIAGMIISCPGCESVSALSFTNSPSSGAKWTWDGNVQEPTLTPSVWMKSTCGWHGHLVGGVWRHI